MTDTNREYRKTATIKATQWFKNGDHPDDYTREREGLHRTWSSEQAKALGWEGEIVRYFRHPETSGERECEKCSVRMQDHGWIDTLEGGHIVCPGDWIATGVQGEHWPIKPDVFAASYVPADAKYDQTWPECLDPNAAHNRRHRIASTTQPADQPRSELDSVIRLREDEPEAGFWRACSGCQESNEGSVSTREALEWLARNDAFDSGAAWLSDKFGSIADETGDDLDWREVCLALKGRLAALKGTPQ